MAYLCEGGRCVLGGLAARRLAPQLRLDRMRQRLAFTQHTTRFILYT